MRYSPEVMQAYLLVFVGAGLGGALRHFLNITLSRVFGTDFPWSTAFINISGSLAMGLLTGWLAFRSLVGVLLTALLIVPLIARMRAEEALLGEHFGAAYAAYRTRTWRLVPWVY